MKKFISILILFIAVLNTNAQVGFSNPVSLEDNKFIVLEPQGIVTYTEVEGTNGVYGLVILIKIPRVYLDSEEGHKVSIEFQDGTREVYTIVGTDKSYFNFTLNGKIIDMYQKSLSIYPDFNKLTSTEIKQIVIQRNNGNIWTIETKPKWRKKLLGEFADAMDAAVASYKTKVSNDDYFSE